jgi:Ca2+-binding EF-hand superfamily protein
MGAKGSKSSTKGKPPVLKESDIKFLTNQTGLDKTAIKSLFEKFMKNNPDGQLDRKEFVRLYTEIRPEAPERLDEISEFVFKVFDADKSGSIDFNEFLVAYALTSRGDLKKKLEYAFALYDSDNNGYLDRDELRTVLAGMLDLLGAEKKNYNVQQLSDECMKE